jgi:hypothetical protein
MATADDEQEIPKRIYQDGISGTIIGHPSVRGEK